MAFSRKLILVTIFAVLAVIKPSEAALDAHYYDRSCPAAEKIILETVRNATLYDPKVPARLLRMFFHDCFIRGCDASILLDSTQSTQAEKDGPPNISVRSFYVIQDAKAKLEKACPRTVSCADVIAIAARDVVTLSGGPYWSVLKGRKDGRISRANETINLPAPTFNVSQLIQSFAARGLSVKDMVTLSGGHTLGFSHCSSFESRLKNFSKFHDVDPSMNFAFAQTLKKKCPRTNRDKNAGTVLDSTTSVFDNVYYKQILAGKGVFGSDQALLGDYRTKWIVETYARDQKAFFREFAASMVKLGNFGVKEIGEAVRSKVFSYMLATDEFKISEEKSITIPDLNFEELKALLEFFYSGILSPANKHARALYIAADKYDIPYLQDLCRDQIISSLSLSNVLDILELSSIPSDKILMESAISLVMEHIEKILDSDRYKLFVRNNPDLSVDITKTLLTKVKCVLVSLSKRKV